MDRNQKIEKERDEQRREEVKHSEQEPPHNISAMKPLTHNAYGGGMYASEEVGDQAQEQSKKPASDTQSADGPVEAAMRPKHALPPSSGDRDIDITGQSYIQ